MFSPSLKQKISDEVQKILRETNHDELSDKEISFILHVDGAESWSWANIKNNGADDKEVVPYILVQNLTAKE